MEMERRQLRERRVGERRKALGVPVGDETVEELDELGGEDRRRADAGLVGFMGANGKVHYTPLGRLSIYGVRVRVAAEKAQIA